MTGKSILITGGTGFLGGALADKLLADGRDVVILSRDEGKVSRRFGNSVKAYTRIEDLPDAGEFEAVVNLAGAGIFDRRWSDARKQTLRDSRIRLTGKLVDWMGGSADSLPVLVSGSAIGFYGDRGDEILDETSQARPDFAQCLCADWEAAAMRAETFGVRVCLVRTGLVLGKGGGVLQRMLPAFRLGLGGRFGGGRQWMSWIHIDDWLAIVRAMIDNPDMRGAYNATAPLPVTNQAFSEALAGLLNRPMLLPMPERVLKLLLGEMASLVLCSQRVMPKRLLERQFDFVYNQLEAALRQILISKV